MNESRKPKIKKTLLLISLLFISFIVVSLSDSQTLVSHDFTLGFFGLALGLSITVISLIYGVVNNLTQQKQIELCNEKYNKWKSKANILFNELEQNTLFIFWAFIISIVIKIISGFAGRNNFTIDIDIQIDFIETLLRATTLHVNLIEIVRISLFLLVLYAIYDSICSLFQLLKFASNAEQNGNEKDINYTI